VVAVRKGSTLVIKKKDRKKVRLILKKSKSDDRAFWSKDKLFILILIRKGCNQAESQKRDFIMRYFSSSKYWKIFFQTFLRHPELGSTFLEP
jgi:hypothetical protein